MLFCVFSNWCLNRFPWIAKNPSEKQKLKKHFQQKRRPYHIVYMSYVNIQFQKKLVYIFHAYVVYLLFPKSTAAIYGQAFPNPIRHDLGTFFHFCFLTNHKTCQTAKCQRFFSAIIEMKAQELEVIEVIEAKVARKRAVFSMISVFKNRSIWSESRAQTRIRWNGNCKSSNSFSLSHPCFLSLSLSLSVLLLSRIIRFRKCHSPTPPSSTGLCGRFRKQSKKRMRKRRERERKSVREKERQTHEK